MLRLRLVRLAATLAVVVALGAGPVSSVESHGLNTAAITNALPSLADPAAAEDAAAVEGEPVRRALRRRAGYS
jgi:hypothetical protein